MTSPAEEAELKKPKAAPKPMVKAKKAPATKKAAPRPVAHKTVAKPRGKVPRSARPETDIGVDVALPKKKCDDRFCPFHGSLPVRGQILEGVVVSDAMQRTVVVERQYLRRIDKYERLEKRFGRYPAHNPPCLDVARGDKVKIMECRPLSKTVSYVVIEKTG